MSCAADGDATLLTGVSGGPARLSFTPAPTSSSRLLQTRRRLLDRRHTLRQVLACHLASPGTPCFTRELILGSRVDTQYLFAGLVRPPTMSLVNLSAVEATHCVERRGEGLALRRNRVEAGGASDGEHYFNSVNLRFLDGTSDSFQRDHCARGG